MFCATYLETEEYWISAIDSFMSNKGPVSYIAFSSAWLRWSNVYRLLQAYTQFWFVPSFLRKEHSYHNRETRFGQRKNAYTTLHKWERKEVQRHVQQVHCEFPGCTLESVDPSGRAWVCGRSLSGTVGLNPTWNTDICLLWKLYR